MDRDVRISAGVNIDGTPYGALPDKHLNRPVMILQSDPAFGKHGEAYKNGNGRILTNLSGVSGYRYIFRRTNHFSFSDFPLFFSSPGRWLISIIAGPAIATSTQVSAAFTASHRRNPFMPLPTC